MRVSLMDEATLEYLQSLAGHLYDYVEQGMKPNEALKKIAIDFDLTPEYIRVVGRAYNSGITNYYIHQERNLKKLAKFELCEPENVVRGLFKTKKSAENADIISTDYLIPAKSFNFKELSYGSPAHVQHKERASIYKLKEARNLFHKAANDVEDLKHTLTWLEVNYEKELDNIHRYFKRADAINPEIVKENCYVMGIKADTLLKQANVEYEPKKTYSSQTSFAVNQAPYNHLVRAQRLAMSHKALYEKYLAKKAELEQMDKAFTFLKPTPPLSRRNCFFFRHSSLK